jgi:hypothetical protein
MLRISYESEDFPPATIANSAAELPVTWDNILWAAVTVGRPNRQYVFRHGPASVYEALFRWSLVRMALEQRGPRASRLHRTLAAKTLDPTEKGAVNYFIGMAFCKLFAAKLLGTPWLLHLDVFRPALNPVLTGRSRPDMVGQEGGTARWHAFECKGRISPPGKKAKISAKTQAERVVSLNGTPCSLHVGAITYLRGDTLHFYWRDPPTEKPKGIDVPMNGSAWRYYYEPVFEAMRSSSSDPLSAGNETHVQIDGADVHVGAHPAIAHYLANRRWEHAQRTANELTESFAKEGYQPDGLKVVAGASWLNRFAEPGTAKEE